MEVKAQLFKEFLENTFENGEYATDDVIAFVIPLFKEVSVFHEAGLVAPFEQDTALFITGQQLDIDENFAHSPSTAFEKLSAIFSQQKSQYFDIVDKTKIDTEIGESAIKEENLNVHLKINEPLLHPAYVPGYQNFEILLGHHDEQTDIFCLGLIIGSMSLGLNLYDDEDLKLFAQYRSNPAQYNNRIHPTISSLIVEMTQLDRNKRAQNLYEIIERLEHYRDYDPEKQIDLSTVTGLVNNKPKDRNQIILNKLRNRLFDTSRRNRLLYYKPNMRFVNLTVSSVPSVLHYQSIRSELLFTWNEEISSKVSGMKDIVLNKYLRFEDHLYLPSSLDKIKSEARRDVQEYGFSQLKLVITFLNWHNLRESKNERIQSPLLLIPAELKKVKKLKEDIYTVKILDNAAEVNPVLSNHLRELYGIKLPDFVDLNEISLQQFYELLKAQIDGANQGITLNYIDKPRIKLVQSIAKQTINNYKKRLKRNNLISSYKNIAYSYQTENYKPLGLEIFRQRIEPRFSFLEFLVNEDLSIASNHLTGEPTVKERQLFQLVESSDNPYSWDFDVCNILLGNFNYKKMSLVRDYNNIIDNEIEHKVFNNLFSAQPKIITHTHYDLNNSNDWFPVITADPTQTKAVLQSRNGESYIIQGPPGTGKSQTITNLIADFAANGKSVLFVCEKRAALDVVYHRLKQQGLDELCCYIHDSQSDKREFIKNLKATYEDFLKNKLDIIEINTERKKQLQVLNDQLQLLQQFHSIHASQDTNAGTTIRNLIERLVELKPYILNWQPAATETIPHYKEWIKFGEAIKELSEALEESGSEPQFSEHPLSKLNEQVFLEEYPLTLLEEYFPQIKKLLTDVILVCKENSIPGQHMDNLQQIKSLVENALLLQPLAEKNNLQIINTSNALAKQFDEDMLLYNKQQASVLQEKEKNIFWVNKFSEQDVINAISIATKYEKSFFNFFSGSWRRLKRQLNDSYDFTQHKVKPLYSSLLNQLKEEYAAINLSNQTEKALQEKYFITDIKNTFLSIEKLRAKKSDKVIAFLLEHPDGNNTIAELCKLNNSIQLLEAKLNKCFCQTDEKSIATLIDELESISLNMDSLKDLLPALRKYSTLPDQVKNTIRTISLIPQQAEAAMANKSLHHLYQQNKSFKNADVTVIENAVQQIQQCYKQLLKVNAQYIRASVRARFLQHIELSNTAISQLNNDEKQFKKDYNEGRKILENEFGKSMRYKSIRELSGKESGIVLKDLKPIWLMSPLSVSDSLPVDSNYFDVVIFDEASQITLEEGIPALYRAPQTIIVGDDKQMPPTNFFTAKADDPDDLESYSDDELLSDDTDSLLVQGSRKLDSVMLGWHYRSRYETLISFSNHAFYKGSLLTIPDKTIHHNEKSCIEITKHEDALQFADTLFDRSLSFHFHPNSVYENRTNQDEANYIAHLIRELLKRNSSETIGIVAFSQEQQHTIEDALFALAKTDKVFEQALEEASTRAEEDQFVGLFVKNLENVQGDERDIIIMSVCYGFDARKKMIMNFGPINKKGGEKRLNVIFSRAKKHMAIISSIKHHNITNEYNEGANYFKRFLQYAEMISTGNMQMAGTVLDSLNLQKKLNVTTQPANIILQQIKQQLQMLGYESAQQVGQSNFKCAIAVKVNANDDAYTLGIMLDDEIHYSNDNLLEQYFQRPAILESFGWRKITVFAKDWLHQPQKVIDQIVKRLKEKPVQTEEAQIVIPANEIKDEIEIKEKITVLVTPYDNLPFERFEFSDTTSNKFWEIAIENSKMITRFGRMGTKGQTLIKTFDDDATALKEKEKMIEEKLRKGYRSTRL
ncbi:MAG: WGR domain-containing protein [Chitinophagaceae bacterium]|nr:WGR domain-containing protein [Chitinophagaceae bacterium]